MTSAQTFVIVGASLAGAKAAEALRDEGFDGRVVLIGEEEARPYARPPLSKEYLRGEKGFAGAAVHDETFYGDKGIELRTSTVVTSVDPGACEVVLASGERLSYDRLLLATGAEPRRLGVPGADLAGVHYLRSVTDADALRHVLAPTRRVVVIGAGWIGTEVAASACQLGADVAMVEMAALPLERVLGAEVGRLYRDIHAGHGVELHLGVGIESLGGAGRVEEVHLTDGTVLPAEVVVAGVGVTPRTGLAEVAGLALRNGVLTDEHLATSNPRIYAAGDVANVFYPLYGEHIRLEHWSAALNQGQVAARNMLGKPVPYAKLPYFFSDQYDFGMEYRGFAAEWDQVVIRHGSSKGELLAFWMRHGRVLAAMNANIWDAGDDIERLVRSGRPVDAARLADPEVPLADLAGAATG
ncbi:MAG: NAD(P)/FAD-dependent oxidoreductase [Acidimicrobiales bacterium]